MSPSRPLTSVLLGLFLSDATLGWGFGWVQASSGFVKSRKASSSKLKLDYSRTPTSRLFQLKLKPRRELTISPAIDAHGFEWLLRVERGGFYGAPFIFIVGKR
ncbi:hypothetical protein GUJ93_ZPchr0001g33052 [Zizania palustris]|uniref:Secreted protein n=1 Tax=Zizania palustris TaxID=103762 RepID=A0A8J5RED3_ZIZPA|nr:hypothetical protein GUJ93_ZPchr0001g33052 [Zizania palustris]